MMPSKPNMLNWVPDRAPILTYTRSLLTEYQEFLETGYWGYRKHLRLYDSGLLYQAYEEVRGPEGSGLVPREAKAFFYPMSVEQVESLSFVLDEFSGQRGDFRTKSSRLRAGMIFSEAHDFWLIGGGSGLEGEILAALWETAGFEWGSDEGGVPVDFRHPYGDDMQKIENPAFDRLASRMSLDKKYVGYCRYWDFSRQHLEQLKSAGATDELLLTSGLMPYAMMDDLMSADLENSDKITPEMFDRVWDRVQMVMEDYPKYLGRGLQVEDVIPSSDMEMWGYLSNLNHWFKENARSVLSDPLWLTCGELCRNRFLVV
jgi:hypothetical protein